MTVAAISGGGQGIGRAIAWHFAALGYAVSIIDLDAVRKARERGWMDLLSYVTGSVEIRAAGKLHTANGSGTFELESASIGGVPISKAFLQEVIAYYSRTADSPEGFNLDKPFKLPYQIQRVDLQRGLAVIVQ